MRLLLSLALVPLLGCIPSLRLWHVYTARLALTRGPWLSRVRVLGRTHFGDPTAYHEVRLTPQHRLEYFRDGFTIVRGALPPQLLRDLRRTLTAEFGPYNSIWSHGRAFDSDALMDFYTYSSLGSIAAQIFESPGTQTAAEKPTAFLWRDFMYFRPVDSMLAGDIHTDIEDCDKGGLPPNATLGNRPRIWVPLDDNVWVPIFANFSKLFELLRNDSTREMCLRGELPHMEQNFQDDIEGDLFGFKHIEVAFWTLLPREQVRLGDVAVHVPCLRHSSSIEERDSQIALLFPTYATASSPRVFNPKTLRTCGSAPKPNATIGDDTSCFVQAWPPEARPEPGSRRSFRLNGRLQDWISCTRQTMGGGTVHPLFCHLEGDELNAARNCGDRCKA